MCVWEWEIDRENFTEVVGSMTLEADLGYHNSKKEEEEKMMKKKKWKVGIEGRD